MTKCKAIAHKDFNARVVQRISIPVCTTWKEVEASLQVENQKNQEQFPQLKGISF